MDRIREILRDHLGGLPSTFWWIWAGTLVCTLATFVFPFLAIYLTTRGFSPAKAGAVVSLYGLGVAFAPISGWLADRYGRRPVILASLFTAAALASVLAFLTRPLPIAVAVLLLGMSLHGSTPAEQAMVTDVVPARLRPRAVGLLYWANNAGMGMSFLLGGLLATKGWALPFLLDAATTFAFALVVLFRIPETRPVRAMQAAEGASTALGYLAVLRDGRFAGLLVLHLGFMVVFWQMQAALPIAMVRHGFSTTTFGAVLAVNTAIILTVQPVAARFVERFSRRRVLAAAASLLGAGYGAYSLCSTPAHYAIATAIWSFGEIAYFPTVGALVADLAPAASRGRYAGAFGLVLGIAGFLAPLIGPSILQAHGPRGLWVGCFVLCVIVAAGHLWFGRLARSTDRGSMEAPA